MQRYIYNTIVEEQISCKVVILDIKGNNLN